MQEPKDDASFRHITCESITIKNPSGRNEVEIAFNRIGGRVTLFNRLGIPVVELSIDEGGNGHAKIYFADGSLKGDLALSSGAHDHR